MKQCKCFFKDTITYSKHFSLFAHLYFSRPTAKLQRSLVENSQCVLFREWALCHEATVYGFN